MLGLGLPFFKVPGSKNFPPRACTFSSCHYQRWPSKGGPKDGQQQQQQQQQRQQRQLKTLITKKYKQESSKCMHVLSTVSTTKSWPNKKNNIEKICVQHPECTKKQKKNVLHALRRFKKKNSFPPCVSINFIHRFPDSKHLPWVENLRSSQTRPPQGSPLRWLLHTWDIQDHQGWDSMDPVDGSKKNPGIHPGWGWENIYQYFLQRCFFSWVFLHPNGGWLWDFWTINSIKCHC